MSTADTADVDEFLAYKLAKEAFVSNHEGGSMLEIVTICTIPLTSLLFFHAFVLAMEDLWNLPMKKVSPKVQFLLEFLLLVMPIIVGFTYTQFVHSMHVGFLAGVAFLVLLVHIARPEPLLRFRTLNPHMNQAQKPFLTNFRSVMNISTFVAILAVDFVVFPRRFCKTETYGTSTMDLGVGCYMLANAFVSKQARYAAQGKAEVRVPIVTVLKSISPVLIIGSARMLAMKGLQYQEHVSEYGHHWNFFFTLAVVTILVSLVQVPVKYSFVTGAVLIVAYQYALINGVTDYIMNAPRLNFFSANKEGILGSLGYAALFILGLPLGAVFLRSRSHDGWWKMFMQLFAATVVAWMLWEYCDANVEKTSRRLVNLAYVMWLLAGNMMLIIGNMFVDLVFGRSVHVNLFHALNRNSLALFMIANLITGIVNLSMKTIYASELTGFVVIALYVFAVCTVGVILDAKNITLKYW